jgi:hypothetical protein
VGPNQPLNTHKARQDENSHLIVPSVYSTLGSISLPASSTPFEISNAAKDMTHEMNTDASANFNPGPSKKEGKKKKVNLHNNKKQYILVATLARTNSSTKSKTIFSRIRFRVCTHKPVRVKIQWVRINILIVQEFP